jgi:dTDP-4-amino-4,6-dideoxygalactose transaminase
MKIPFLRPSPPALSDHVERLRQIEQSGIFSNFGPVNSAFERAVVGQLFVGQGACVAVANATLGLMLALKAQLPTRQKPGAFALMPSYTFAATAHAALWCGLTPLFCDIDPATWMPAAASEEQLLREYGSAISAIIPYATFGAALDLERYAALARRHSLALVVDAAASLGTRDHQHRNFGTGFSYPLVYSMHVTKTFATSEAGLVYSSDRTLIDKIRTMANFGFGQPRHTTMPGLNAKLSEVGALLASLRLADFDALVDRRCRLYDRYRQALPDFEFQAPTAARQVHQFVPALVPAGAVDRRDGIIAALATLGIGAANYFSPHLAQQAYFRETCSSGPLTETNKISARSLSLPLSDTLSEGQIDDVCRALRAAVRD